MALYWGSLYHCHPKFTLGAHEIGEDTGLKRHAKPTEFRIVGIS